MRIQQITDYLEAWAPLNLQESYDNSGLIIGDKSNDCTSALISLDVTEEVIDEAIEAGANLIISHHPFIFKGIKRIGEQHWIDRCIRKAIKHEINLYAIHTNLDHVNTGVNKKIAEKLGLEQPEILQPKPHTLAKLEVFVPLDHKEEVAHALFKAGAGSIGNYDECSFQTEGVGTFKGNEGSNPTIGTQGSREQVVETRLEVLVRKNDLGKVLQAMHEAHPYEEVAHFITDLQNANREVGSGMVGLLPEGMKAELFLEKLKSAMNLSTIRHTKIVRDTIHKVAVCGGSGSFLLNKAIARNADIFISADFKYHDFFEANDQIIIADIGHYESEVYTKELLVDELTKTFARFAFRLSKVDTNPIKYF